MEIKQGWRYLARHRVALHLTLMPFIALLCTGTWTPLAPSFIRDRLGGSDQVLGWQLGTLGIGTVLGGIIAPALVKRFGAGVILFVGFLAEGALQCAYALASNIEASMAVIFLWGVAVSVAAVPFYSILQAVVEKRFLGRVFSVIKQSEQIALVLAMLFAVVLRDLLGSHLVFLLAGLLYLGFTAALSYSKGGKLLLEAK